MKNRDANFLSIKTVRFGWQKLNAFIWSSSSPNIMKTCPYYKQIFRALKIENFQLNFFDIFLIFAQNIDCGYSIEPPRRGGSNEYPQSMFWSKNKKNRYTPPYPSFAI